MLDSGTDHEHSVLVLADPLGVYRSRIIHVSLRSRRRPNKHDALLALSHLPTEHEVRQLTSSQTGEDVIIRMDSWMDGRRVNHSARLSPRSRSYGG